MIEASRMLFLYDGNLNPTQKMLQLPVRLNTGASTYMEPPHAYPVD